MSQIKLESANELELFLKILAEESVLSAREEIKNVSEDPALKTFSKKAQADSIDQLKAVREEVTEEEEEAEAGVVAAEDEAPEGAELEETEVEETEVEEHESTSLDTIIDTIKQLRSGKSVDDGTVKPQIRAYYDRLNDAERETLATFIKVLAGFVTGDLEAQDAQDPSDPPMSITIDKPQKEKVKSASPEKTSGQTTSTEEEEDIEEEDTEPPIKVGSRQQVAEIRKRVKKLMTH
tara:strand:+ start:793 stop:1500 length:708 start_codon:yes stop_codon:yes gene_type:complete